MKNDGTNNPAYDIDPDCETIYDVVKQSRMSPDVGEVFRLMFYYTTNGRYTLLSGVTDIMSMASTHEFMAFPFDAMQSLYRSGYNAPGAKPRNTLQRDMEKALTYIEAEHERVDKLGKYYSWLDEALCLMRKVVSETTPRTLEEHGEMRAKLDAIFGEDQVCGEMATLPTPDLCQLYRSKILKCYADLNIPPAYAKGIQPCLAALREGDFDGAREALKEFIYPTTSPQWSDDNSPIRLSLMNVHSDMVHQG